MVWPVLITIGKPFIVLWAALNVVDDLSMMMRLGRLAWAIVPKRKWGAASSSSSSTKDNNDDLCGLCDDVMGDLLRGTEGLSVVPCHVACLGVPKCMQMCEAVQELSAETTEFPCVAAGYCSPAQDLVDVKDPECSPGPFFSCQPRQYCRRRRQGVKMTCDLRPGIGRWMGLQHSARHHVVALASGLLSQPHCSEPNAGPYCIARPKGLGAFAERVGQLLALLYGGYQSVLAIESPGGSDDRQWLTFWLLLALSLYVERFFARVILSTIPFYYEAKLAVLVWLLWQSGAEKVYRRLRRVLVGSNWLLSEEKVAERTLAIMKAAGKGVVEDQLVRLWGELGSNAIPQNSRPPAWAAWAYDENEYNTADHVASLKVYAISKFLLSPEGAKAIENSTAIVEHDASLLLERAAEVVSFQPRYLRVFLRGVIDGRELPPMDRNGLADPYMKLQLRSALHAKPYPKHGIRSRILYKTLRPVWNQELELALAGGSIDADGYYRSNGVAKSTVLVLSLQDADVGEWSIAYYFFSAAIATTVVGALVARIEGLLDDLTTYQGLTIAVVMFAIVAGFIISYAMAAVVGSNDEVVGNCELPLDMLLDQREHHFKLTFQKPDGLSSKKKAKGGDGFETDAVGVVGVTLSLSEH